jgi:preprotein translocase subunit SecG
MGAMSGSVLPGQVGELSQSNSRLSGLLTKVTFVFTAILIILILVFTANVTL